MFYRITLNKKAESDEINMNFEVPPSDIPSYAKLEEKNGTLTISLEYCRDDMEGERKEIETCPNPRTHIVYGTNSGRIYTINLPKSAGKDVLNHSIRIIKNDFPLAEVIKRPKNNIEYGVKILKKALDKYHNSGTNIYSEV